MGQLMAAGICPGQQPWGAFAGDEHETDVPVARGDRGLLLSPHLHEELLPLSSVPWPAPGSLSVATVHASHMVCSAGVWASWLCPCVLST